MIIQFFIFRMNEEEVQTEIIKLERDLVESKREYHKLLLKT